MPANTSINEFTGKLMKTKAATESYKSGWDRIFGAKTTPAEIEPEVTPESSKSKELSVANEWINNLNLQVTKEDTKHLILKNLLLNKWEDTSPEEIQEFIKRNEEGIDKELEQMQKVEFDYGITTTNTEDIYKTDNTSSPILYQFNISVEDAKKVKEWLHTDVYPDMLEAQKKDENLSSHIMIDKEGREIPYFGAIGGETTYSFTHTGVGTVTYAECNGKRLDLTDYSNW
jgi:hypothetical protein